MKKYWAIFKISWAKQLEYRVEIILFQLSNIIVFILFFYVWKNLTLRTGAFATYTQNEILTYVLLMVLLRPVVFGSQSREMAMEINDGIFSKYLAMPINYFWYNFFRELAYRATGFLYSIIGVTITAHLIGIRPYQQSNLKINLFFLLSIILAIFLYYVLSYIVSMLAFWSREAMGPRFLYEWILESSSGVFFPIDIFPNIIFTLLSFTPFIYMIFFPISIYLNRLNETQVYTNLLIQIFWISTSLFLIKIIWRRGLKAYSGEGI